MVVPINQLNTSATWPQPVPPGVAGASMPLGAANNSGLTYPRQVPSNSFAATGLPNNTPELLEDPAAGPPAEKQLFYWGIGSLIGLPISVFFNEYLFKPTTDGNRYRLYKLVSFIDRIPVIHQISKGIDQLGDWVLSKRGNGSGKSSWLGRWIKRSEPYIEQFRHTTNQTQVLKYHADDYLTMLDNIGGDYGKTSPTMAKLRQQLDAAYNKVKAAKEPGSDRVMKAFYKDASTAFVGAARQVVDERKVIRQAINDEIIAKAPNKDIAATLKDLQQNSPNLDHARLKLSNQHTTVGMAFSEESRYAKNIMRQLAGLRDKALHQQSARIIQEHLSDNVLKQAGLSTDAVQKIRNATTLADVKRLVRPGIFRRIFGSPLTSIQRKALKQAFHNAKSEIKLRRRIYGAYGRLQGIKQFHLPFYNEEVHMSKDLKKLSADSQFTGKKKVGALGRTLATFIKAVRDAFAGGMAGGGTDAGLGKFSKFLPKNTRLFNGVTLMSALMAGAFFMNPLYQAEKAEKGDKAKTFFYHFLGAELGMIVGWQVGSLLFNEVQLVPNITRSIDSLLRKVGSKRRLSPTMFRHMKWPFVTLIGLLSSALLPTFITGSAFSRRGEKASSLILGKPKSIIDYESQQKIQAQLANLSPELAAATFNNTANPQTSDTGQLHQALRQLQGLEMPANTKTSFTATSNPPVTTTIVSQPQNTQAITPPATGIPPNSTQTALPPMALSTEQLDNRIQQLNGDYQGTPTGLSNDPYNGLLDIQL